MARRVSAGRIVSSAVDGEVRTNTVRLKEPELELLLSQLDSAGGEGAAAQREFARWVFRAPSVDMQFRHSSGSRLTIRVAARNLSCGGMSVLHNAYVHQGTQCTVHIPHPQGRAMVVSGKVVRCQHLHGMIHELGVMFSTPINIREFCNTGPLIDQFSFENVDAAQLRGTLLIVSGSELQRKLAGHYLAASNVNIREVSTCEEAMKQDLASVDIVMADQEVSDGTAEDLLTELRAAQESVPFVVIVPKAWRPPTSADAVSPDAYIRAPLDCREMLRALAEFLLASGTAGQAAATPNAAALRANVLRNCETLESAQGEGDAIGCYSVCLNLRDSASAAGLDQITRLAARAAATLGESLDVKAATDDMNAILNASKALEAA